MLSFFSPQGNHLQGISGFFKKNFWVPTPVTDHVLDNGDKAMCMT